MKQTYLFHIQGMRCASCALLIEDAFKGLPNISYAKASFAELQVKITGDFTVAPEAVAEELTGLVKSHGYAISLERPQKDAQWGDFIYAVPIAMVFIVGFLALQKAGLTDFITASDVSYATAFAIGLIASVSTCLAVVGGLVLSLSASSAKEGGTWRTQMLFHSGRLGGFFVLGGVIGVLGSSFQLGLAGNSALSIIVALVMLVLGINLLDIFHFTERCQFSLPARMAKYAMPRGAHDHYLVPALIGAGTFFLPCGFTQSMQIYTLTAGSFLSGALTMTAFALGTLPVLALLSFGALNISHKSWKGMFFKTAGIIVIALALFNLANVLATAGIINLLSNQCNPLTDS